MQVFGLLDTNVDLIFHNKTFVIKYVGTECMRIQIADKLVL